MFKPVLLSRALIASPHIKVVKISVSRVPRYLLTFISTYSSTYVRVMLCCYFLHVHTYAITSRKVHEYERGLLCNQLTFPHRIIERNLSNKNSFKAKA